MTENKNCDCKKSQGDCRFIALTGGPGAGKTAVLELLRKHACPGIAILPESASIVFGGGFWRHNTLAGKSAAQRAIYRVQAELERMVSEENQSRAALCDRGSAGLPGLLAGYGGGLLGTAGHFAR